MFVVQLLHCTCIVLSLAGVFWQSRTACRRRGIPKCPATLDHDEFHLSLLPLPWVPMARETIRTLVRGTLVRPKLAFCIQLAIELSRQVAVPFNKLTCSISFTCYVLPLGCIHACICICIQSPRDESSLVQESVQLVGGCLGPMTNRAFLYVVLRTNP